MPYKLKYPGAANPIDPMIEPKPMFLSDAEHDALYGVKPEKGDGSVKDRVKHWLGMTAVVGMVGASGGMLVDVMLHRLNDQSVTLNNQQQEQVSADHAQYNINEHPPVVIDTAP